MDSKTINKTIFTLESRENSYLEVTKEYFKLTDEQMYLAIQQAFVFFIGSLSAKKNINYKELRNTLTPNINKKEIALIFDSSKIKSAWYGFEVFDKIIPLFNKKTSHSILSGDLIIEHNHCHWKELFFEELISERDTYFLSIDDCYIVYINNLSNSLFEKLNYELLCYEPYVGYLDTTFQTPIKSYVSTILCKIGIINKDTVILPGEDEDWRVDENTQGLPFDKYSFIIKSVPDLYFGLFLSYKIERAVFEGFEADTEISLNAVSPIVKNLNCFKVMIEPEKLKYLLEQKGGKLKKAQLENYQKKDFENLIKEKIKNNYIYELTELKEHNIVKFNIVIELDVQYTTEKVKCNVSLVYNPEEEIIRLITLF